MRRELAIGADNQTGPAALSTRAVGLAMHMAEFGSKPCGIDLASVHSGFE